MYENSFTTLVFHPRLQQALVSSIFVTGFKGEEIMENHYFQKMRI